jgi:hypothetical protein
MSLFVCQAIKCKKSDVRGLQIHNQRESKESKNEDIDHERSALNYDLHNPEHISYTKRVNQIMKDGYTKADPPKSDAVQMVSVLISSDKEFFDKLTPEQTKEFFQINYDYLKELYGEKNIVNAMVHLDEKTPHMTFQYVPLTEDGRLCAKEINGRTNLNRMQDELPKLLQEKGFELARGEISKGKHLRRKDSNQYKLEQLKEVEKDVQVKLHHAKDEIDKTNKVVKEHQERSNEIIKELQKNIIYSNKEVEDIMSKAVTVKVSALNPFSEKVIGLPPNDIVRLRDTALVGTRAIQDCVKLTQENKLIPTLKQEIEQLKAENKQLTERVSEHERVLKVPAVSQQVSIFRDLEETERLKNEKIKLQQQENEYYATHPSAAEFRKLTEDKGYSDVNAIYKLKKVDKLTDRQVEQAMKYHGRTDEQITRCLKSVRDFKAPPKEIIKSSPSIQSQMSQVNSHLNGRGLADLLLPREVGGAGIGDTSAKRDDSCVDMSVLDDIDIKALQAEQKEQGHSR